MSEKRVTDEQILTQRKFPRRSFLTAAGALLAGAAAVASGVRVSAQEKKATDPDSKDKPKKTAKKSSKSGMKKGSDPDKKKTSKPKAKPAPKSDPDGSRL